MTDEHTPMPLVARFAALFEVVCAFALLHVTYRAIKHFTTLGSHEASVGLNLTPGITMIAFTVALIWLHGKKWVSYGFTLAHWPRDLSLALVCILAAAAFAGPPIVVLAEYYDPRWAPLGTQAVIVTVANLAAALLFLVVMRRDRPIVTGWPALATLPLIAAVAASPIIAATCRHKGIEPAAAEALWLFVGAGFGEEFFFRSYVQSRVDLAFAGRWSLFRTPLGPGILVAAALFGMIHVLNPVDYFHGRFGFAWWWFPGTFASGLLMGCIRARTGSVLPCAVIHGLGDIMGVIPRWLA
jgi:membrane protease YdiL (CAAX protease family)